MSESLLQKQFQEKDLQRARNLISGQYGAATTSQVGYEKVEEEHKEGDVWTDGSGKTWTIEDGIKISVSKLQKARDAAKIPLMCPKCGKAIAAPVDKKMYRIHGMCLDCVTRFESALKRAGLYQQYEQSIIMGNLAGFIKDALGLYEDMAKNREVGTVTQEGEVENWGKVSDKVLDNLSDWIQIMNDHLTES